MDQDVPTKTDPKTAETYIETPDEFGRPVRRVVGMDEAAGAKLQLESDTARHAIDHNNWQAFNEGAGQARDFQALAVFRQRDFFPFGIGNVRHKKPGGSS